MDGLLGPYFGNPNIQRQAAKARALSKQRDVNLLPDPKTYAVVQGLLGTAPDELGFSVLHPQYQAIRQVADPAFAVGTLLGVAPAPTKAIEKGAMAAGRAGERLAERVVPQIMERGGMPAGLLEGMSSRTVSPLTVYHGSPAKFERFDPTKIGSGEGAQAYGYGHYVAQAKETAEDYRKKLSDWGSPYTYQYQGQTFAPTDERVFDPVRHAIQLTYHQGKKVAQDIAKSGLLDAKKGEAYAIEMGGVPYYEKMLEMAKGINKKDIKATQGFTYTIDLPDEQIAKMLDWDKPLSEQTPFVKQALQKAISFMPEDRKALFKDYPLQDFQIGKDIKEMIGERYMQEAGIPGIRYLDQGSRGAGEGTSNFVVFPGNEDMLTILKRNGGLLGPYPQEQALQLAQKNAAKPISEGGLGLPKDNTPMDRAKAMGFDTPIYHATSADFEEFVPSSLRGASYFASSPERAMRGAKAGAADRLGAGQPDRVMPLVTRSQEVEGLTISKPQREWFNSLPEEATESQVQSLMNKAPKDGYWFMWYDEIKLPSGEFKYVKKQEPFVSYEQAVKTNKDIYGRGFNDYSDASSERFASEMAKNQGRGAYLQNDESGLAMAVVDPSIVRSRFAAFDPARRNEADILAGVLPLSLLADEEQRKKADVYFRSLLGQ